ncbi:MAG: HAD hydrolase-like protein [Kiritimatiellae bacterium]|nr:HAD hydrolase-like protein [Kiritimatiellia bacterium]
MTPYIIWDWNGTLLDDVDAAVNALNRMLVARNVTPTTRAFYRAHFGFPVRPFYATLGVDLDHDDWDQICRDFHAFIGQEPQSLRMDAHAALAMARDAGIGQSLLSALREDLLVRDTARYGVDAFMDAICGVDNLDGATKLSRGQELIAQLKARAAAKDVVFHVIGDTLHDAEVAQALGARCILVDGGHQSADRLAASGFPVAASPLEAVQLCRS